MRRHQYLIVALVCWLMAGLLCARFALAGTYSLTTTASQDEALQFVVDKENTRRAAQTPPLPAITIEQYLQQIVTTAIPSYRARMRQERVFDNLKNKWSTLITEQKQVVCTQLGVSSANCPQ